MLQQIDQFGIRFQQQYAGEILVVEVVLILDMEPAVAPGDTLAHPVLAVEQNERIRLDAGLLELLEQCFRQRPAGVCDRQSPTHRPSRSSRMPSMRRRGSAAPHSSWSPTVKAAR